MSDKFTKHSTNLDSPAKNAFAISPVDNTELTTSTRSLYIGGAGTINCILVGDTANTSFIGITACTILPIRVKTVHLTGTTATGIVGLY